MIQDMKVLVANATRVARQLVLASARITGISKLIASSEWRRNRLLILCYHGISLADEHKWEPGLFMSREVFRSRLQLLRSEKCAVLPLGEAIHRLKNGSLPPRSVAITFDDGFYNFSSVAAPLLREFNLPAAVYVSTFHCQDQRPILRLFIRYALWCAAQRNETTVTLPFSGEHFSIGSDDSMNCTATKWWQWLRANIRDHDERLKLVREGLAKYGVDCEDIRQRRLLGLMTLNELREVSTAGFGVELHTHRHQTPRDIEAFRRELLENGEVLNSVRGTAPEHFCYPSGDHDASFLPVLKQLGIVSATTCETALATAMDDPLLLPRYIDTMGQSQNMYTSWLSGTAQFLARRVRTSYD